MATAKNIVYRYSNSWDEEVEVDLAWLIANRQHSVEPVTPSNTAIDGMIIMIRASERICCASASSDSQIGPWT